MILFKNKKIDTDQEGYLKNYLDWNECIACFIAEKENIVITQEHWEVLYFLREFYEKFNISPTVNMLVRSMTEKYGQEKNNSIYFFRLFPHGPAKQATKIAGLPKSSNCL